MPKQELIKDPDANRGWTVEGLDSEAFNALALRERRGEIAIETYGVMPAGKPGLWRVRYREVGQRKPPPPREAFDRRVEQDQPDTAGVWVPSSGKPKR